MPPPVLWLDHVHPSSSQTESRATLLRGGGGGGVKVDFPVFTYLIRAAGDEQEEKNGPKSDLAFLRYRVPNIEVYM